MANEKLRVQVTADTDQFVEGMRGAQAASAKFSQAAKRQGQVWNNLAYALDDVQYGFRGVQNNLQQIAIQSGLGGPVVLALTAATIAIGYLIEKNTLFANSISNVRSEYQDLIKVQLGSDEKIVKLSDQLIERNNKERQSLVNKLIVGKELSHITKAGVAVYKELSVAQRIAIADQITAIDTDNEAIKVQRANAQERLAIAKSNRQTLGRGGPGLYTHAWVGATVKNIQEGGAKIAEEANKVGQALQQSLQSAFVGVGQAIGEGLKDGFTMEGFLKLVSSFMKQFGAALIAIGVAKISLESNLPGGVLIAAGVGLVAAGALLAPGGAGNFSSTSAGSGAAYTPSSSVTPQSIQGFGGSNGFVGEIRNDVIRLSLQTANDNYNALN